MTKKSNSYLGAGKLSAFIEALDKTKPVNVQLIVEGEVGGTTGIGFKRSVVLSSQEQENGEVLYHYWITAEWQELGGEAVSPKHDNRSGLGLNLVQYAMTAAGLKHRPFVLAWPKDTKIMAGSNDLVRWDKEKDLYYLFPADELATDQASEESK